MRGKNRRLHRTHKGEFMEVSHADIASRLVITVVLSSLVGLEREMRGRAAGLRTHILVGLSTCLLMMLAFHLVSAFGTAPLDPSRIPAGIVTGIGILCAGTILRYGSEVTGLTTAASLWATAALGIAVGAGFFFAAYLVTAFILITLLILSLVERFVTRVTHHTNRDHAG